MIQGITCMPKQLYIDMDGVLADFDTGYKEAFGVTTSKQIDNVDWGAVRFKKNFYLDLPPMPDMQILWNYCKKHNPIVLTGIPHSVEEAADNKTAWVRKHLGRNVRILCCLSKEKSSHCTPGDVLVDDWEKYKDLWVQAGGIWVTHTSAETTIKELALYGY